MLAAEQGLAAQNVDIMLLEPLDRTFTTESRRQRSSVVKRLCMWKKV